MPQFLLIALFAAHTASAAAVAPPSTECISPEGPSPAHCTVADCLGVYDYHRALEHSSGTSSVNAAWAVTMCFKPLASRDVEVFRIYTKCHNVAYTAGSRAGGRRAVNWQAFGTCMGEFSR